MCWALIRRPRCPITPAGPSTCSTTDARSRNSCRRRFAPVQHRLRVWHAIAALVGGTPDGAKGRDSMPHPARFPRWRVGPNWSLLLHLELSILDVLVLATG